MPVIDSQFGQDDALDILSALVTRGSVPHALLFTGIPGLGKVEAARHLAMALNCQGGQPPPGAENSLGSGGFPFAAAPCHHCRSCRKIRSGSHPDVISIEAAGAFIRIDQIRALGDTLAMKPYEARCRVVIIRNAQAMNAPAGNALLKMLEEPPDQTILILTATRAAELLPTVVSRCRLVRFSPLPPAKLTALLVEKEGVPEGSAAIMATMANGSVLRAIDLGRKGWVQRRNWLLNRLNRLPDLSLAALMALAATLSRQRESLERYLDILDVWARDVAVCRMAPAKVICRDVIDGILAAAHRETAASALEKAAAIQTARQDLKANTNPRLTMEVLLLRLADAGGMFYDTGE